MNVNSPEFLDDPYRFYKAKRAQAPLFRASDHACSITGYEIMSKVLAHPAAGRGNIGQTPTPDGDTSKLDLIKQDNPALQILDQWMLFKNPPEHTEMRGLVADVFTLKMINRLEVLMRSTMQQLIADITHRHTEGTFEAVSQIAYPFPITVICEMIGIPHEDRDQFHTWTQDLSIAVECDFMLLPAHERIRLNKSAVALETYFKQLVPFKKSQTKDDLMSRLIEAGEGGMPDHQLLANCVFLLFAGQETTTSLISNSINALLQHPQQLGLLQSDPGLIGNAVEECLRYDPPVQMVGRIALDNIEVDDIQIPKGNHIFAFLGAAGRDPAVNDDPDKFDIRRKKIKHLVFARGAHHCLGASLARLELKVVLEELINGFAEIQLAGQAQRKNTWLMRGFDKLPVHYRGR